jgi:hypothetical protein
MALRKPIVQPDGVTTEYHRILFLQTTVNSHVSIAVLSYLNADSRQTEKESKQPYKAAVTYETAYDENMTIESAYEYLKTLPEFEGAEDVYEEHVEEETPVEDIPEEEEPTDNTSEDETQSTEEQ